MKNIPQKRTKGPYLHAYILPSLTIGLLAWIAVFTLSSFSNSEPINSPSNQDMTENAQTAPDDTLTDAADTIAQEDEAQVDSEEFPYDRGDYTSQQTRRGERLFKGLLPFESGQHDCSSCHYTSAQEEINWNPAAWELAEVWAENPEYSLETTMNQPLTARLMEDHEGMTITREEQHLLEAYYTHLLKEGPDTLQAYPIRAFIFWGLGFLMLLAIIDLIFTRVIKFKGVHILILFAGIAVHGQFAMAEAQNLGRTQGYAPDQPIKFSHLIHAGENDIDCNYCHTISSKSLSAGIPSNNTCLNCHNVIQEGTLSGQFEINKIHRAEENGEPIEWIRVHNLPDHSFFSHAQHVNAGQLECTDCHGDVETMHIVKQEEDLSMGWCLTCHRENDVDFLDNPYFEMYEKLHDKIKSGEIDGVTAAELGGEDCMSCHY